MSSCVLDVQLEPTAGPVGAPVTLRVRPSDPSGVAVVRVNVVGYGYEETLYRSGGEWLASTTVPYEASPGEYLLDIYAVDAAGQRLGSARATFTVTG